MPSMLAVLALSTPIFGFSLQPPAPLDLGPSVVAQLAPGAPSPLALSDEEVSAQLRQRQEIATVHRVFGVMTLVAMLATTVFGFIQFADEYGFHGSHADTACAHQSAVFQDSCTGVPVPHVIAASALGAFYVTTFALSFAMPDPLDIAHQSSAYAGRVRAHAALRWVHLTGMLLQVVLGVIVSEGQDIGIDPVRDFGTLQALAAVHMGIGVATLGALTTAAALVTF